MASAHSSHPRRGSFARLVERMSQSLAELVGRREAYHPERHYMRGPRQKPAETTPADRQSSSGTE